MSVREVCEERGWLSLSRVDAMAQWEQRYFLQLAKQWRLEDRKVDLPKDFLLDAGHRADSWLAAS